VADGTTRQTNQLRESTGKVMIICLMQSNRIDAKWFAAREVWEISQISLFEMRVMDRCFNISHTLAT
jgi:hypothetical protein